MLVPPPVIRNPAEGSVTARQMLLYQMLGLRPPAFTHLPLVRGTDGLRLAKRHGDTRLPSYKAQGVRPQRIIGLLGFWAGAQDVRKEMSMAEFSAALDLSKMPRDSIVFTPEDEQWLVS